MKFRGVILLLGSVRFVTVLAAQTSSDELPSAPSAVKQERSQPKPPPPAPPPASGNVDRDDRIASHTSGRFARRQA